MKKSKLIGAVLFVALFYILSLKIDILKEGASKFLLGSASYAEIPLDFFNYFQSKDSLLKENSELKRELELLKYERINAMALRQDLKELRALMGNPEKNKQELKLARLEPSVAPRVNFLLLEDRPDENDYYVLGKNSFLIAYLSHGISKEARLYSANSKITPAYIIQEEGKVKVSLQGKGSGAFVFELNKEYDVKEGDIIFYKSIPLAVVRKVESSEQSPYYTVYAALPINLNNLDFVLLKNAHD